MDYQKDLKLASWKPDGDTYCRSIQRLGNGRIAAIMADRSVSFLDEKTLAPLSAIPGDGKKQPFYYATVAQKGTVLALATFNGTLLADAEKPEEGFRFIASSPAVNGAALSNDGQKIAVGNRGTIEIRGTRTGDIVLTVEFKGSINRMAWSDSGRQLAVTTSEHGIFVINTATGEIERNFGQSVNINPLASRPNCAVSDDSRKFAMIDEQKNLTLIDLAEISSSVTPSIFTSSPEMMAWSDVNQLIVFTESSCRIIDANGKSTKSIRPVANAFDVGPCGPKAMFFRTKDKVAIFNRKENDAIPAGGFPMGVTRRCEFSSDGKFALVRENDEPGALSIRAASSWDVVAQAPEVAADPLPRGLFAHPDGTSLTWIDTECRVVSFDLVNKRFTVLREPTKDAIQQCFTSTSAPDWLVGFSAFTNPPTYRILNRDSGKTLFESLAWDAFTDEIDLVPLAVTPDRKHLWFCGPAGHLVLVKLETGSPVFEDSHVERRRISVRNSGRAFSCKRRRTPADPLGQSSRRRCGIACRSGADGIGSQCNQPLVGGYAYPAINKMDQLRQPVPPAKWFSPGRSGQSLRNFAHVMRSGIDSAMRACHTFPCPHPKHRIWFP